MDPVLSTPSRTPMQDCEDQARATTDRFLMSANRGDLASVKGMLAAGVCVNATNQGGENALHWAAMSGHLEVVSFLLHRGISPDNKCTTIVEYTPFMWACSMGHEDIAALLLPLVDLDAKCRKGETAIMKAEAHRHVEIASMIRSFKARSKAMRVLDESSATPAP